MAQSSMISNYQPADWYWQVGSDNDKVWSSARFAYVANTDAKFRDWLSKGNVATAIDTPRSLLDVMLQQILPLITAKGVSIISSANSDLNGTYAVDSNAQQMIVALSTGISAGKQLPGGQNTFSYPDINSVPHSFTAESFMAFATSIEDYIYNLGQAISMAVFGVDVPIPSNTLVIP
jgi:hypothetical protein